VQPAAAEPGAGVGPVFFSGFYGDPEDFRRLSHRATEEVAQFHQFGLTRRFRGQEFKHLVDRQDFEEVAGRGDWQVVRIELKSLAFPTALKSGFMSRLLDQDAAHGLGGRGEEVPAAVPPLRPIAPNESHVRLVH